MCHYENVELPKPFAVPFLWVCKAISAMPYGIAIQGYDHVWERSFYFKDVFRGRADDEGIANRRF